MNSDIQNPKFELNTFTTKNYIPEKDKKSSGKIPGILVLLILIGIVRLLFVAASALNIPKFVVVIFLLLLILIPSNMLAKKRVKKLKESGYFDKNVSISEIKKDKASAVSEENNTNKEILPKGVQPANLKFFQDYVEIEFPKKEIGELMPIYETNKMMFDEIESVEINDQTKTLIFYGDIETKTYHYYPNGDINPNTLEIKTENSSCWFKIVEGEEGRIVDAITNNTPFEIKRFS